MPEVPVVPSLDVVGVGNALVDVLATTSDAFLSDHGLVKGSMALIDPERASSLYDAMPPAVERSGGTASNTAAGVASLGGRAGFIGRVRDDQLGAVFAHDIRSAGVSFTSRPATSGPATGRSYILVTPDAQRTMNTYLGAASDLGLDEVDEALVASAEVVYLEGYLFDRDPAQEAFARAAAVAHGAGRRVALSLSDSFCVERFRPQFLELVSSTVDVLFANADELVALYETDVEAALDEAAASCSIVAVTRGPVGSTIVVDGQRYEIAAEPVEVVDTTGAGDLYAAGVLFGLTSGRGPAACGRLGSIAAAEVISHLGARPEVSLADLVTRFVDV